MLLAYNNFIRIFISYLRIYFCFGNRFSITLMTGFLGFEISEEAGLRNRVKARERNQRSLFFLAPVGHIGYVTTMHAKSASKSAVMGC